MSIQVYVHEGIQRSVVSSLLAHNMHDMINDMIMKEMQIHRTVKCMQFDKC